MTLPWTWMLAFVALPFALIVVVSLSTPEFSVPPYRSPFEHGLDTGSYARIAEELQELGEAGSAPLYLGALGGSLVMATLTTLGCGLLGYPFAYHLARSRPAWRQTLLLLVMLPFWTSFLLRVFAWMSLLDGSEVGLINQALLALGLVGQPLQMLYSPGAVLVGMVYSYLPFMVLPLYAHLVKLDLRLLEAARDLGAPPWRAFVWVTLPLSLRGIVAGSMLVFIPAVGEFVIPDLLGGGSAAMLGRRIWDDFGPNQDWPMAAATAVLMVLLLILPWAALQREEDRTLGARGGSRR